MSTVGNAEQGTVIAEVLRENEVESRHLATAVLLDRDGAVEFATDGEGRPVLPRSAIKPLQAVGMRTAGLSVPAELLALVSASHTGSPYHVDLVERLLREVGLSVDQLHNPPALPLGPAEYEAVLRAGGGPARVYSPCSGKHAGMLATCLAADWPIESYEEPTHPLQLHLRGAVEELGETAVNATLRDGCGAPTFSLPLVALARAFRRLVTADPGSAPRAVADAMRSWPDTAGGGGRAVTAAMKAVPGLLAKDGAEGVLAMALPDGRAAAVKILDGADRALGAAVVAVLQAWGVPPPRVPLGPPEIRHRPLRVAVGRPSSMYGSRPPGHTG